MKLTILLLLLPALAFSQLSDNFNDGDFSHGVSWTGNIDDFRINTNKQLQLYSSGEGFSYLSANIPTTYLNEWSFLIKLAFSPSDNNQCIVYLVSDNSDPSLASDAYYLKFGKSGSDDAIELYRKNDTIHSLVAAGTPGFINASFCIRVKVTRDDGIWQIWADSTGGYDFLKQIQGSDDHWGAYSWFSVLCRHTSSNAAKFYFDDVYAGPIIFDISAPSLTNLYVTGTSTIDLVFNEQLLASSCANLANYTLGTEGIFPEAAGVDTEEKNKIHLLYGIDFSTGTNYNLKLTGIKDIAGNRMRDTIVSFLYRRAEAFDILINEIMADPDPPVSLPDCEYLELYNRTNYPVKLEGWHLNIGSVKKEIPSKTIDPYGYLILTTADTLMNSFGDVVQISGLELTNSGNLIYLTDNNQAVIHAVTYSDTWYRDAFRENGGWSLELVDPDNPCGSMSNWKVSADPSGGSPGKENSVKEFNSDNGIPHISYFSVPDNKTITIHFNEQMDSVSLCNRSAYLITKEISAEFYPVNSIPVHPLYESVTLTFPEDLDKDINYYLKVQDTISDCCGNILSEDANNNFRLPYDKITTGLILNELLYDATIEGEEFIEIYNRTDTAFHLENLMIATLDPSTGQVISTCRISESRRLMMPHSYIVLTRDPNAIQKVYYSPDKTVFIKLDKLPTLSNSGETIALMTEAGKIIDQLTYNDDMHFALLRRTKGVSLERIDPGLPADNLSNWHSASQNSGFATPGYRNSQYMLTVSGEKDNITIEPETFSPDNDGSNDQLSIIYKPNNPGDLLTIRIFDSEGRFVKFITGNYLTGSENIFFWDGITDQGTKAQAGIYIIYIEVIDLSGKVQAFKKVAVVASR